jgi:adenylate kinase family enzyme
VRPVVIVTGPPGAGKSTVAARFARGHDKGVHLHTDDFWHYIVAGAIPPYEPQSQQQNETVMEVIAAAAENYAAGGYLTVVDGIVGPWMLDHFRAHVMSHPDVDLHYVVLRPRRNITLARAKARNTPTALVDDQPIIHMWNEFADLGALETHVIDSSYEGVAATTRRVSDAVNSGQMRLEL